MMKNCRKIATSIISVILILLIGFTLPVQAVATVLNTAESSSENNFTDETTATEDEANILCEDISKRDEYTKYFITDAGTTIAAQYGVPVHYKNADGDYVDFDNSLITSESSNYDTPYEATADEASVDEATPYIINSPETLEETFTNKKSNSKVSHFKKTGKAKLIEITRDNHTISWGYSGANIVIAKEMNHETETLTGNDAYLALPNLSSTVLYENIYNNIDLEVINSPTGVKENLILKKANTKNVFMIEYNIGELTAESKDTQTIELKDNNGNVLYTISAPYMTDANGERSDALELKILQNNKGKLSVKLTADKNWLKDKTRAYPVTVDPAFSYGQDWGQIRSTFINSGAPNTSYTEGSMYVGRPGDNYIRRSLIKIPNIDELLNVGDMIVDAKIILWQVYNQPTIDMYAGVYESNSDWTKLSSVTWNNQPGYSSTLIDYEKCAANSNGWRDFDITELVKKWYSGAANNGFYLVMLNESDVYQGLWFSSSSYPTDSTVRPQLQITYRNNKGLEPYWSYTPVSAGAAGVAYINDYSGNLVFQTALADTHGLKLPTSLGYTYNSYLADGNFTQYTSYAGYGFQTSLHQTVKSSSEYGLTGESLEMYPYVYTDGDGTEHYFYECHDEGTKYYDEDGLELELITSTPSTYIIKNKDNFELRFNRESGKLTSMKDSSGNIVEINYDGATDKILSVTDANGQSILFSYNGNLISKITDPAGRETIFTHNSNKCLTKITYPNNKFSQFGYDTDGRLTSVTNIDNASVTFTYDTYDSYGIETVEEHGTDGTLGQQLTFDRSKYNTTVIRSSGADCVFGNNDDINTIYQFDDWGKTVSVQSKTISGEDLGAAAYTYTESEPNATGSNIKKLNKVTQSYALGANRENLAVNHNMESLTSWTTKYWFAETVDFTASENSNLDNVLYGQKSLKINVASVSGDARGRVYQNIPAEYFEKGETYTLSAYVKTAGITPVSGAENYGAVAAITPVDSDSSTVDSYSEHISRDTDININNGFRRISVTFTVPDNNSLENIRIQLALRAATGTAYFDGIQLEKGDAPSPYNMIENASFERSASWSGTSVTTSDGIVSSGIDGGNSLKITGSVSTAKNYHQDVYISGEKQDTYILSGWAKGNAVPNDTNTSYFELRVRVYYSDGTNVEKRAATYNTTVSDWQYASFAFNLDNSKEDEVTPTKIRVYCISFRQGNTLYFDNLMLTKEAVPSYTYNDEGDLVSVVENAEQNSDYEFNNNRLTKYTDPKGGEYTYEYYEPSMLLKTATTQMGATSTFVYDDYGNPTSAETVTDADTENSLPAYKLKSTMTYGYPAEGDTTYTITAYDQDGRAFTETYNAATGMLTSTKDAKNILTQYTYNADTDRLERIERAGQSVEYTYDNFGKLTSILHAGTTYSFLYDIFGNKTSTQVGSRTLATYTYGANNGNLMRLTYGNGNRVDYTYDRFGNFATVAFNGTVVMKNFADSRGDIVRTEDLRTNLEHRVTYDSTGRLISKDTLNLATASHTTDRWLRTMEYDYDRNNNLTKLAYADTNGSNVTTYTYGEDNLPQTATLNNNKVLTYSYDKLGRLISSSLPITSSNTLTSTYTYATSVGRSGYTTNKLATEETPAFGYKYNYDALGNIIGIYEGVMNADEEYEYSTTPDIGYVYDSNNQLTTVNDYANNEQYQYEYNSAGNITRRYHYSMNSSWLPSATLESISYAYADTNGWKDLLTKYNGQTITYDAIGNPLNYRDGITMTWQNGRELTTFSNDNYDITFSYDASGMRTKKSIEGVGDTEYVYEGGQLLQMQYLYYIFDFSYGADGRAVGFSVTNTDDMSKSFFYYALNSRGDVIALYNSAGTKICTYSYDAYGKLLSTALLSTTASDRIASNFNPLRYRSYVYDRETGFYYLQTRYYDPTTCRFVNGDGQLNLDTFIGHNQFAYCNNNPVYCYDPNGLCALAWKSGVSGPCPGIGRPGCLDYGVSPSDAPIPLPYRDVTDEVNKALIPASNTANVISSFASLADSSTSSAGTFIVYSIFAAQVFHKAPWDIKREKPWENTIKTQYPGYNVCVIYEGVMMTPEELGNYTYGYLGKSYGIPLSHLYIGSYCAALFPTNKSDLENELNDWQYITMGFYRQ